MRRKVAVGGLSALLTVVATLAFAGSASATVGRVHFWLAQRHAGAKIEITCDEGPTFARVIFREVVLGAGTKAQLHRAHRRAARRVFWISNACEAREEWEACIREKTPELKHPEWELEVICGNEGDYEKEDAWREPPRVIGLFALAFPENVLSFGLNFTETGGVIPLTEYRVTVKTIDGEAVRWLAFRGTRNGHYVKIWEGTDAFVNYCIDRSKEIRSKHGRLFCKKWIPSTGQEMMTWRFRPL